ncbi:MAG TPA: hypothetical protein DDW52_03130 [Planctomycetaceae bacterium]|nr:hypothetical protein [Planctomycetaceae bacterium]
MPVLDITTYAGPYPQTGAYTPSLDQLDTNGAQTHQLVSEGVVEPLATSSEGEELTLGAEQSGDFTAEAGYEYPVDLRAYAVASTLIVSAPASPSPDDRFAVFDAYLMAGNGTVNPERFIRIEVAENLQGQTGPDYAVVNNAGGRIELKYVSAAVGWRIHSTPNT